MLMDAQARPSNAQSVAAAAGTIVSTDSIDLLSAADNPGRSGMPLRAIAVMVAALTSGGASTIQAQLISSDNSNLSTPTVLASGPVLALAAAGVGAKLLDVPLPDSTQRYLGFQYLIGAATSTGGSVTAGIVGGTDRNSTVIPMNTGL